MGSRGKQRALVVEDDGAVSAVLAAGLERQGFVVDVLDNGADAVTATAATAYDVIVLDVHIPPPDGLALCRLLRSRGDKAAIVLLTRRGATGDRIRGLDAGADDYLPKPFDLGELRARVDAALRRRREPVSGGRLSAGGLELDPAARTLRRGATPIELTAREFELLQVLMERSGTVCSRHLLLELAWDFAYDGSGKVVDVYVGYLRRKIDDPFGTDTIETVRGVGYRLRREAATVAPPVAPGDASSDVAPPWRALAERLGDAAVLLDGERRLRYVSPVMVAHLGHRPEDTVGRDPVEFVHHDDRQRFEDDWQRLLASPSGTVVHDVRAYAGDGTLRWIRRRATNLLEDPDVGAVVVSIRDVTSEREQDEALATTRRRFAMLSEQTERVLERHELALEAADIGIWEMDIPSGRLRWADDHVLSQWAARRGWDPGAVRNVDQYLAIVHPQDRQLVVDTIERGDGGHFSIEYRLQPPDGETIHVSVRGGCCASSRRADVRGSCCPVDAQGRPERLIGTIQDVTERVQAEQALERQREGFARLEKLGAVGELAAGVAHDFANLLTVITGNCDLLEEEVPERASTERIRAAAMRARSLVEQLLDFSGVDEHVTGATSAEGAVVGFRPLLADILGSAVELEVVVSPGVGMAAASALQLERIVLNLAVNARDAMPDGGRLEIRLERRTDVPDPADPAGPPSEQVVITVRDAGVGMDADTLARATEPLFSTKSSDQATGMGLAVVQAIVTRVGGRFELASVPNGGTTATVYLPAA